MESSKKVDVGAVIDAARFSVVSLGITVMMIIIMLTDGFDLLLMSYIGTNIANDLGVTIGDVQPLNVATLIGMAIGSVGMGWVGDRVGRKLAYVSCLFLLFIGSLGCYYSANVDQLYIWRLITGLGTGGVTPLAATLVSEWTGKRIRNVVVAIVIVAVPLGGALARIVYGYLVPEGAAPDAWRLMFLAGALVPLVLFATFTFLLPESPKYMAKHPKMHKKLARSLNRLLGEKRFEGNEVFYVLEPGRQSRNWFATSWNRDFRVRTALIWVAFVVNSFVLYMFSLQLKTLLEMLEGFSGNVADTSQMLLMIGAAIGSIGGAFMIGLFGSKWVGTGLASLGVVAVLLIGLLVNSAEISIPYLFGLTVCAGASVNGMQSFLYTVGAHSYPTELRGSAVGMAQTVSRLGAAASPMVAAFYFDMQPRPGIHLFLFFLAAIMCITVVSFFFIPSHIPRMSSEAAAQELAPGDVKA